MNKILIITPFFVPAYSYWWIVKVAYDQALGLIKKWYDVTVAATDVLDSKTRNKILDENIDSIKIKRFKNISNYLAKFQNLYLTIWMQKWLKNNIKNYDIVHIHDIYNLCTYWWYKYALANNKKYFIQPHWTLSDIRIESRKKWLKTWILKKLKYYFDKSSWFFALTKTEIKEIEKITDNKNIFELPNWLDLDKFIDIKAYDIHNEYDLSRNIKIITFLGRIQYIKWIDISLNILAELDKSFKDWRFLVIWPDEWEKEKLIGLSKDLWIGDKIIWYWLENTDKKYRLLAGSDLFMFSSRSEWFPMTLLESIACNTPVFISKWCNLDEADWVVWSVIDIENIDLWSKKLLDILDDNSVYKNNCTDFIKNYDINILINKLISYYGK